MQRLIHKLRLLLLFLVFSASAAQLLFPGNAIASGEFETVMLGDTKVLLRESDEYGDEASVFAIMLAGNGHQGEGETHCAHVAEHMVFRNPTVGGVSLGDWVSKPGTGTGGVQTLYNGWTGPDHTHFEITVPGRLIPEALTRLVAGLFPGGIETSAYETELGSRLKTELEYMTTNSIAAPYHQFNTCFYQGTPYSQKTFEVPVIEVESARVLEYMNREYSSSRLIIVLVGDFEKDAVLDALEDALEGVPTEPNPVVPDVRLNPASFTSFRCAVKHPIYMIGVGVDSIEGEDAPFVSAIMSIALGRLWSQPPDGFRISDSLSTTLAEAAVEAMVVSYEATRGIAEKELQPKSEDLVGTVKAVFGNLLTEGPDDEEVAGLLVDVVEPDPPEHLPRTLFEAWWRGLDEIPGVGKSKGGSLRGMSHEELAAALKDAASRYTERLQYSVMVVEPGSTLSPVFIAGAVLAGLVLAAVFVLRWRRESDKEFPAG